MPEKNYQLIQIDENAWRIEDDFVRMFLFAGADKAVLIDTGFGGGEGLAELVSEASRLPVMLVNTHAHHDHIGANSQFGAAHMHPAEFAHYAQQDAAQGLKAIPLWDGDVIDLGDRRLEAILIPGHTPGSIALLDRENRFLIGGDSVQEGPIFMFDKTASMDALIASAEKLIRLRGSFDRVFASHGEFSQDPSILDRLKSGALCVQSGQAHGQPCPFETPVPAKIFQADGVSFILNA